MTPTDLASQLDLYGHSANAAQRACVGSSCDIPYHLGKREAYGHAAQLIRDHLVPRWSTALPTVPGAYWYQDPKCSSRMHEPILVTVWRFDGHETLYAGTGGATGDPSTVEDWAMKDSVWCGPLPEPPEAPSP